MIEDEKNEHDAKLAKMEREMEEVFERKVREKNQRLAETESELSKNLQDSEEKLEQQKEDLENRMAEFEKVNKPSLKKS